MCIHAYVLYVQTCIVVTRAAKKVGIDRSDDSSSLERREYTILTAHITIANSFSYLFFILYLCSSFLIFFLLSFLFFLIYKYVFFVYKYILLEFWYILNRIDIVLNIRTTYRKAVGVVSSISYVKTLSQCVWICFIFDSDCMHVCVCVYLEFTQSSNADAIAFVVVAIFFMLSNFVIPNRQFCCSILTSISNFAFSSWVEAATKKEAYNTSRDEMNGRLNKNEPVKPQHINSVLSCNTLPKLI